MKDPATPASPPRPPKLKTLQWSIGNPFTWTTLQSLVFHPLNVIISTASMIVVLGSILSHLYLYVATLYRYEADSQDHAEINLSHCITKAAATDITIHEYFHLERDKDDDTLIAGIDLHVKKSFLNSTSSIEFGLAALYFVSLKPLCSSLFFYIGPLSFVAALISVCQPSPDHLRAIVDGIELWTGWTLPDAAVAWLISGEHLLAALLALICSEFAALVSHDIMRVFCCEWHVEYDPETLNQLLPIAIIPKTLYGAVDVSSSLK
ncbi:hypothetical protein AeMF1_006848 [Aphanomyces euteiches]|nr:hypothetical protein AeMF1_006848 [Aphanomyces euteiches]KAH9193239.1 hypothetical protein AeNC1_004775 [Aphanomyces euteiches]